MSIKLSTHDKKIADHIHSEIKKALGSAQAPVAVAKRISSIAVGFRNKGRKPAIKRYPFKGICEASGLALADEDKVLDELEPEIGYKGPLRWVCHKANNSGKRSCGGC